MSQQTDSKLELLNEYPFLYHLSKHIRRSANEYKSFLLWPIHSKPNGMFQVEKIEQAILAKAFRGELVEPVLTVEPAIELLKRILAEKAKLEGVKKGAKNKRN